MAAPRALQQSVSSVFEGRLQRTVNVSWTSRRCESSQRRMRRKLRVKPESSFSTPDALPGQTHIIFNPPSSIPPPEHTPSKFLPKDDLRLRLFSQQPSEELPPPVRKQYEKQYHLTEKDIERIRHLRQSDEKLWTRQKLAKEFNCSSLFIGMVCEASEGRKQQQSQIMEATKSKWGQKRTMAREDRTKRRDMWGRDQ